MVYSMIALYDASEKDFKTAGLGSLYADTASCTVHEEINGEFELSMTYKIDGEFAYLIKNDNIIYARPNPYDAPQPFRIYDVVTSLDDMLTISAHHISYDLDGYIMAPFSAFGPSDVVGEMNEQIHGRRWNINKPAFNIFLSPDFHVEGVSDDSRTGACNVRSVLGGSSDSLVEKYGVELSYDGFDVQVHNHRGKDRGVCIQYGVNLLDLEQESDNVPVYDIFPFYYRESGDESLYIDWGTATSNNQSTILINPTAPVKRTQLLDLSSEFDDIPTNEDFINKALEFADEMTSSSENIPVNLTLSVASLKDASNYKDVSGWTEDVHLGDTVTVIYRRSTKVYVQAKTECISTTYDVLAGKYTEMQFGKAKSSLSSTIANQISDTDNRINEQMVAFRDYYNDAVKQQTALITGNKGGYVIIQDSDKDGYPDRILVMDDLDITKAQHIWQWNKSGLGYSDNNGKDYIMGMDMEGHINGKLLSADSVEANKVLTGWLGNPDSGNYWNLNTGEFRLVAVTGSTVGGKLIATEEYAAQYADQKAGTAESNAKSYADIVKDEYKTYLTQREIFDRLTNRDGSVDGNRGTQGIFMSDNRLYLNAEYMEVGLLASPTNKNVFFDLNNGRMHCDELVSTDASDPYVLRVGKSFQGPSITGSGGGTQISGALIASGNSASQSIALIPATTSTYDKIQSGTNGVALWAHIQQGGGSRDGGYAGIIATKNGYLGLFGQHSGFNVDKIEDPANNVNRGGIIIQPENLGSGTTYSSAGHIYLKGSVTASREITCASIVTNNGKNRAVETDNYGIRLLYSYETTAPMFGDIGEAITDDQGCCVISINDVFEETIITRIEYQVFLQKEGPGDIWVDEKAQNYFVVRGTPGLRFSWELKAEQKDLSDRRLIRKDSILRDENVPKDYSDMYDAEREQLIQEMEKVLYETN